MGCLDIPSALAAFAGKFRWWKQDKLDDSKFDEEKAVPHDSTWAIRNPLLDMPAGNPFNIAITQPSRDEDFIAVALRDDQIQHSIISDKFAIKHKMRARKSLSGLPDVSTDSSGDTYNLKGYFEGCWWLPNTHSIRDEHIGITVDKLPDGVDILLSVSEKELGIMRTSAERKRLNVLCGPNKSNAERTNDSDKRKAADDLEKTNDSIADEKNTREWIDTIKKGKKGDGQSGAGAPKAHGQA